MAAEPVTVDKFVSIWEAWSKKYGVPPLMDRKKVGQKKVIKQIFKMVDANHDGKVTGKELKKALERFG